MLFFIISVIEENDLSALGPKLNEKNIQHTYTQKDRKKQPNVLFFSYKSIIVGDLVAHHSSARCKIQKIKTGEEGRYKYKGKRGKNT